MKNYFRNIIIIISMCLIYSQINAEIIKTTKASTSTKTSTTETPVAVSNEISPENFRCEKFREGGISELKLKMLENCDLNRPFSNSLSLFAGEETILYCCHKKIVN